MRKILVFCIMIVAFMASGCSPLSVLLSGPSKCDDVTEPSLLCDLSAKVGVRLENVGNLLIIVNAISIGEGLYSSGDALEVLAGLRSFIERPTISYADVSNEVHSAISEYPGLFTVAEIYLQAFDTPSLISDKDQRILATWLDNRIRSLE